MIARKRFRTLRLLPPGVPVDTADSHLYDSPNDLLTNAGKVDVRAVRLRAVVLEWIDSMDLNIVTDRLVLAGSQRFDLIIATNVLVYYDVFEQSLALANIAAMLGPGRVLVINDFLHEMPSIPMSGQRIV